MSLYLCCKVKTSGSNHPNLRAINQDAIVCVDFEPGLHSREFKTALVYLEGGHTVRVNGELEVKGLAEKLGLTELT